LGFVFNFITYGGHQIDGMAGEEFAASLQQDGMLALARLQRKFRLLDSPYKTPQTLVGGPRLDAALMASSGRTATTRAMGKGSTQFQHLVQTEVPTRELEAWLERWAVHNDVDAELKVQLRPYTAGSEVLELVVRSGPNDLANVVFGVLHDRRGRAILSVRDQNTHSLALRRKRLMTLMHLYLIRRYNAVSVQYLTPTEDNYRQAAGMRELGFFASVSDEVGEIIVADVDEAVVTKLVSDGQALQELIEGGGA
ncbi:MAG: isocitrate lyase, partial [bacterium]|nr:isocitrate lyase [bacterium]